MAALLAGAAAMVAMVVDLRPPLLMINETPSLPRGVYRLSSEAKLSHGAIVAIAQPRAARPYLASLGAPADMWILKRVAATGGDAVCAVNGTLAVPERRVQVWRLDRAGRLLPRWDGCRALAPDELFLLGETPTSFDSRYFGPVRAAAVEGTYRELLVW